MTGEDQQTASHKGRNLRLPVSIPPSLGQNPREMLEETGPRTAGLELAVQRWWGWNTVERGGPEVALGPGPATRWRLKAGNGGQGERGAAEPRKRLIWTRGQSIQPQMLLPLPMVPQDPRPTHTATLISPFTRPRQAGPPLRATFKQRQTCLSPPPTLGLPLALSSCPRLDFKKNLPEGKSFFWKFQNKTKLCKTQILTSRIPSRLLAPPSFRHTPQNS